ncbi:hypothetical protein PanNE5_29820 [Pandoraea sp. NE5]|uniref:hypothetical protein n=1 Tax=Pandoraea sp. NE5 TaxID=2904129 RepID=UPI0021C29C70|nr:hypothetical protein [Pandoraea sp. NE5]BDD93542.1 hypothetical protein PanNE5_29820 [Pandoraea sp. NE5]
MTPDTVLMLGDFAFARTEIPEHISFGGQQALVVHKMVGGVRHVQAMGDDPMPLSWSGLFFGSNALERALYLKTLKESGQEIELIWSELYYLVVIREFTADFERWHQLPYRITCEVVEDLTRSVRDVPDAGIDALVSDDMLSIGGLSDLVGDGPLSTLVGGLNTAIGQVSSFAKAAQSTINGVLQPLNAVRSRVQTLIASTNNTLLNVTTLGGILPNNPISQNIARLTQQVTAATQLPVLAQLNTVVGRLGKNLGTINAGTKSLTLAGSNLYRVAANEYGDAMGWTTIAAANGITDPVLNGVNSVKIPPYNVPTGGVFNA